MNPLGSVGKGINEAIEIVAGLIVLALFTIILSVVLSIPH
jgi:hypothetical protein